MRTVPVVCVLLIGCHPTIAPITAPYVSSAAEHRPSDLLVHDSAAAAVRLPALHAMSLPSGFREIRLSGGHGMASGPEYPLLRLVGGPDGVHGEIIAFRTVLDTTGTVPQNHWSARVKRFHHAPDWEAVLRRLDGWGIPDLVSPHYDMTWMDAGDLLAETRTGGDYKALWFNAPGQRRDSVAARAVAVLRLLDSLNRASD